MTQRGAAARFASVVKRLRECLIAAVCAASLGLSGCGNPVPGDGDDVGGGASTAAPGSRGAAKQQGEAVKPPFAVSGELGGLLLVWFDEEGSHIAKSREEIPESARQYVRVDSPRLSPEQRLDADHVYVADVRTPGADGSYPVAKYPREWLDSHLDSLTPAVPESSGVTLYMASWCGACRAAAAYMKQRGVDFVEKDIEKDAAANSEMRAKAKAAGKTPRGVPVIDFHGNILLGFDQGELARLIEQYKAI